MVDFKHGKICYIFMPSQDPEKSGAFYREVFGWSTRTDGDGSLSFDDSTGQVSGIWVTDRPAATEHNLEVHIMVDDLDDTIAAIRARGGQVNDSDVHHEGERWGVFTDPDGNRLGIYQHGSGG